MPLGCVFGPWLKRRRPLQKPSRRPPGSQDHCPGTVNDCDPPPQAAPVQTASKSVETKEEDLLCSSQSAQEAIADSRLMPGDPSLADLFVPQRPYPLWDGDWNATSTVNDDTHCGVQIGQASQRCRHVILIRHGQYNEASDCDSHRGLTYIGQLQAELTGKRLGAMFPPSGGVRISRMHVSGLLRARETAAIISDYLPHDCAISEPDPRLNEGVFAVAVPGWTPGDLEMVREDRLRGETTFQDYFHKRCHRESSPSATGTEEEEDELHECEVIVGHANHMRYWICRALQLPPEAWLRFQPFNCSITYLIVTPGDSVQMRLFGDVGHMPQELVTYSGCEGWNWHGRCVRCLPGLRPYQT
eukprot:TRINITY_DN75499_c0_g1_i1.p1 TRINITY_DN75499_c0_g1~~TRINITY_DN75499_c0_g1_i1.p1  ORF type:complete len:358 (-),score=35.09 TRINITY_DN75499_c0_g1_i1:42-1115(-)